MSDAPTLREALETAIARLDAAGVESPRLDAELLLAAALDRNRTYLFAHLPDPLPHGSGVEFEALISRRAAREPLPYILGTWEFLGMPFRVTPAVLIPRPETEVLAEAVAARLPRTSDPLPAAPRVLDVGTGSGCIAIGIVKLHPHARVTAFDASREALEVAAENARQLGFEHRVHVRRGVFPEDMPRERPFDAVVSNPPYVPTREVDQLAPEVREYEPRVALDGGWDGLQLIRELIGTSPEVLLPSGFLAMEVMQGQAEQVAGMLREHGAWMEPEIIVDLAGVSRVVLARRA